MIDKINKIFKDSIDTKKEFFSDDSNLALIERAVSIIIDALKTGGKIITLGNGGSAADSQHLAAEMTVRFEKERKSLPCIALSTNSSSLTAAGNDYGFTKVFSRQLEGLLGKKDVVIAISTSGESQNVLEAVNLAKERGNKVIALSGKGGGKLASKADIDITVKAQNTARIQEVHITIIHAICSLVDSSF